MGGQERITEKQSDTISCKRYTRNARPLFSAYYQHRGPFINAENRARNRLVQV